MFGRLAFPGCGMIARVGRVDPDQVAADGDHLVGGRHVGGSGILSHLAMVASVGRGTHRPPSFDWWRAWWRAGAWWAPALARRIKEHDPLRRGAADLLS